MSIREQIARIGRGISKNNAALVPATKQQMGLATPKMVRSLATLYGNRPVLAPATDITTLDAGYYIGGSDTVGVPDTSNENYLAEWFIDVVTHTNGDKLIRVTQIGTGRSFKRIIPHAPANMNFPQVWVREYAETILWAGNAPVQAALSLTLTDDIKNYNGLQFQCAMGDIYVNSRIETSTSTTPNVPPTFTVEVSNVSNTVGDATVQFIEIGFKASANKISVTNGKGIIADLARGTAKLTPDLTIVSVKEIIGIR